MLRSLFAFFVLAWIGNSAVSQEVAIVLTGKLYDRGLTKEETEEAHNHAEKASKDGEESSVAIESLRLLDARAKLLKQVRSTAIVEVGKSVKCGAEAESMLLHAHLNVLKLDDSDCELDITCAVGTVNGSSMLVSENHYKSITKLYQLQVIGSSESQIVQNGQKQTHHSVQSLLVMPAGDHPLSSAQLTESLSSELIKRIRIPKPGKLTNN